MVFGGKTKDLYSSLTNGYNGKGGKAKAYYHQKIQGKGQHAPQEGLADAEPHCLSETGREDNDDDEG